MRFMQPAPARETLALSRLACKLCTATSDMPFGVAALLGRFLPRLGPPQKGGLFFHLGRPKRAVSFFTWAAPKGRSLFSRRLEGDPHGPRTTDRTRAGRRQRAGSLSGRRLRTPAQ